MTAVNLLLPKKEPSKQLKGLTFGLDTHMMAMKTLSNAFILYFNHIVVVDYGFVTI